MRILNVVPSYIPAYRYGGPIYSVHGLCKALAARGHDMHVFTTNVDGPYDSDVPLETRIDIDGVKVSYFSSKHLRRLYWSPSMQRALNHEMTSYDLVHLHSIFLWPTSTAAHVARMAQVPYVISPRGMLIKDLIAKKNSVIKNLWIRLIEKKNLEHAAAIHFTSKLEANEAIKFRIKLTKSIVVPNGIDIDECPQAGSEMPSFIRDIPRGRDMLLFIGRINWKKGLDRLITAMPYLPDTHLIVAGNDADDYQSSLEKLAVTHNVTDRITFTGPVYGSMKTLLLKHATALVLLSYSENFGNVILEAMAVGCPVVVTPEVGIAEIVNDARAGIVVDGNSESIGESIKVLLSNPDLMHEMGLNGKKLVQERFVWDKIVLDMERLYLDILNR